MKKPGNTKSGASNGKKVASGNRKAAETAKKHFTTEHNVSRLTAKPKPGSGDKA